MDKDTLSSKPKKFHKALNIFLMFFNVSLVFALYSILDLSRRWHIGVDPDTVVYTGSALANFFLRKEFIVIPILLMLFMVVKEFKVKPFKKRVIINLLVLAIIVAHTFFVGAVPFIFSLV